MTPFSLLFCSNYKNTCKYNHEIKLAQSMDNNSGKLWTMQKTIIKRCGCLQYVQISRKNNNSLFEVARDLAPQHF